MATGPNQDRQMGIEPNSKPALHSETALPDAVDAGFEKSTSMDRLIADAKAATDKEHKMTLMQGIRLYPKAVFWSMIISTCIVMEGYDISLVGNLYGFPAFNRKYGEIGPHGTYQIPARVCSPFAACAFFLCCALYCSANGEDVGG